MTQSFYVKRCDQENLKVKEGELILNLDFSGSGYFKLGNQDETYYGNLYLNSEQGGILLKIEIKNTGGPLSYLTLPLKTDYISGELTNGFKLTLYKCNRTKMQSFIGSKDTFTYEAQFIFEGIEIPKLEQDKFSQVIFTMSDIILWGEASSYKIDMNQFSLNNNDDNESIEIYADNDYSIEYFVSGTMLPVHESFLLVEEIKLTQEPVIIIKASKSQNFNYFLTKYNIIKQFIEIAIKKEIHSIKIQAFSPSHIFEINEIKHESPINVNGYLIKRREKENTKFIDSHSYLFSLKEVLDYGDFNKYVGNCEKLEPIIDLYLDTILSTDTTAVRAFLNITQALETYHSRFKFNGTIPEFKKRIDKIILKNRPTAFKEDDKKFLMANSKYFVTLESRLAELLLSEFEVHFYTGEIDYNKFPEVIAKSRNYYTHYDENLRGKIIEREHLVPYVHILMSILEYYLLDELGFNDFQFKREKVWEALKDVRTGFEVRAASMRK